MPDMPPYPGTPRWVKLLALAAVVLAVLFGIVAVTDIGGVHGPARHMGSGTAGTAPGGAQP